MQARAAEPLWRGEALRRAAGDTLRPGGFALTDRAAELGGVVPGMRVLDAGAGLGASVARLRSRHGARAVGVEPSAAQLARRDGPRLPLARADILALPFTAGTFGMVLCECVLSLLPDPAPALAECARVLAPGGVLAVTDLCLPPGAEARAGADGCARDAPPAGAAPALARAAGLDPFLFEDHSPLVRDLAARLILAGESPGRGCAARRGYYLLLARKPGEPS